MKNNIDEEEVNKFASLASRWWDKNSEFKPLHDINPLRVDYIKKQCGGSVKGKRILDVGCGGGILAESLALEGAEVTGIDVAKSSIEVAKIHLKKSLLDIKYELIEVEEFVKTKPKLFDVVTCLETLEHVPKPYSIVNSCAKLAKKNGKIFFSTINRNPKSYLFAIVGAEYVLNLLPKGTHYYDKFIKPSELEDWCREANLNIKSIIGMTYNPISKVYSLKDNVSVNYLCCFDKK